MTSESNDVPIGTLGELMGFSVAMQRVYAAIHKVGAYSYPVLICGERGTGKECAARAIHALGPRKDTPFVSFDCTDMAPTLFEPELFGYVKGAFAGASQTKWGSLALAGEGTLFLNEVADLPLNVQAKLLRVLEQEVFRPIGSASDLPFRARVITASRRDQQSLVKSGEFLENLYVNLGTVQIGLPPLRERKSDIPLLADFFLEKYTGPESSMEFSLAAMSYLLAYDWPGNIRELENAVKQSVSAVSGPIVGVEDLDMVLKGKPRRDAIANEVVLPDEQEKTALVRALGESKGDADAAATRLGIGRATFSRRLKYYGLGTRGH